MRTDSPLVSIGLPVYNGLPHLQEAVATLLDQQCGNFELVISDNASTDGTTAFCRRLASEDPRLRYHLNATNIGAMNNFRAVLDRARGKYFMWAAHDDRWNSTFVSSLLAALEATPEAVLATPIVIHVNPDGSMRNDPVDRPAGGVSGMANLKILAADHAIGWFYGLYRTDWLRRHYDELAQYPVWGNDCLWLADVALRYKVVGSQRATMWKRTGRSRLAPQTARATVVFWTYLFWYFAQISFSRGKTRREQFKALAITWGYVYRLCIRRPNLPRTVWRVVRMVSIAAPTSLPLAVSRLALRRKSADAPVSVPASDADVGVGEIDDSDPTAESDPISRAA
jgi:glycosyltransferase involved in cell wall biosynthesis